MSLGVTLMQECDPMDPWCFFGSGGGQGTDTGGGGHRIGDDFTLYWFRRPDKPEWTPDGAPWTIDVENGGGWVPAFFGPSGVLGPSSSEPSQTGSIFTRIALGAAVGLVLSEFWG